ncbi:MAG: hypothetical protein FWE95_09155 [Planctomycetaceae bacterium]|nr:hypothetical protein [Planctomycetaceae bacterium]
MMMFIIHQNVENGYILPIALYRFSASLQKGVRHHTLQQTHASREHNNVERPSDRMGYCNHPKMCYTALTIRIPFGA